MKRIAFYLSTFIFAVGTQAEEKIPVYDGESVKEISLSEDGRAFDQPVEGEITEL